MSYCTAVNGTLLCCMQLRNVCVVMVDLPKLRAVLPAASVSRSTSSPAVPVPVQVGNMAYMARMGLWGPTSAFPDFESFLDSMKKRGVSFMELLAMEMKAAGRYVARGLSFRWGFGSGCIKADVLPAVDCFLLGELNLFGVRSCVG